MKEIIVIAHNIRSTHNVGALFRTAEGLGVAHIICSGYTPYPHQPTPALPSPYPEIISEPDTHLPHIRDKLAKQIHKTALGAEVLVPFSYQSTPDFKTLRALGFTIAGLEQDDSSVLLPNFRAPQRIALLLGEEVDGITPKLRAECDVLLEIPMAGKKESFNVSVAAGMALYQLSLT